MKKMILALAVAMATMAAATQCYATPITIAFEGQVSDISGTPHDFGANVGDAVSGTLTFNPTTDLPFASGTDSSIFQSPAAFTFSTGASGSGAGAITTGQTVFFGAVVSSNFGAAVGMTQFDPVAGLDYIASYLSIAITTTDQIPVASSLSSLSLASYLANAGTLTGALWFNTGALDMPSYMGFNILSASVVAATPIPPALLMFMTALGGLGFVGWQRRRTEVVATA